jgi:hypothetical protein
MMDLEMETYFEEQFERRKNNPEAWGETADTLWAAANVLLRAQEENRNLGGGCPEPEYEHLDSPATLLYGFALENLIKGYLIKKHNSFDNALKAAQGIWKGHNVSVLAAKTGIPLTETQQIQLKSIDAFIIWAGRYPIPLVPDKFTVKKQLHTANNWTPTEISWSGIELLKPFWKQMEDAIFAESRKKWAKRRPHRPARRLPGTGQRDCQL